MEINKGIRAKMFFLFIVMGAVPFLVLVVVSAINTIDEMEESYKQNSLLRNKIVSDHMTRIIEENQAVLKSIAMSPNVIEFIQNPTEEKHEYVSKILYDTDVIFNDMNTTVLTGADGEQIIRTDGSKLVNIKKRQHFQEAMKGRSYVSDIMTSMSTGKMIVVIEVPVFNAENKPIGMVQRNFNLIALQDFVEDLDDSETSVVIMDRTGRIIVNSENIVVSDDYVLENSYKFILDRIYNSSGILQLDINGVKSLATYSRNIETGWMIVTVRPYHYILDRVYDKATKAIIFGVVMLFIGTLMAYFLT